MEDSAPITAGQNAATRPWQAAAEAFWEQIRDRQHAPAGLHIVCEGTSPVTMGSPEAPYEIHGSEQSLHAVFSGESVLFEEALKGRIKLKGSFQHALLLSGFTIELQLGGRLWI